jgi:UDP-2-acetamido-2,6-beta-L-arabino-hexul-4-ose reductase
MSDSVGAGLTRALYSTYISYLPPSRFSYPVPKHADPRGVFVEMLKTPDSGQFSFFTAHPGVTRGGHYHHTKTEKFLVIRGEALFRFRNLLTDERIELRTSGENPQVVDTIPGWAHDITNEGEGELIVMLWANENFDRMRPDTVASEV